MAKAVLTVLLASATAAHFLPLRSTNACIQASFFVTAGLFVTAYIRWLIFGEDIPNSRTRGKKPVKDQKELARLLAAFGQSRIANNINQLAKAANSGSLPVNLDVLKALNEASRSVHWIRNTLTKALGLQEKDNDPESQ